MGIHNLNSLKPWAAPSEEEQDDNDISDSSEGR